MNKSYLIATACNQKCEEFLLDHWLKSLKENVNLSNIDILVIDFGLSEKAKDELEKEKVILHRAESTEGHINNLRFYELRNYLIKQPHYEQIILCDSADLIFQADIYEVFEIHKEKIKGVCEEISPNMELVVNERNVRNSLEIKAFLKNKRLINAGFVVYPSQKFIDLSEKMFDLIIDKKAWGVDMVVLNYLIYHDDFFELPEIYNFIPTTSTKRYFVRKGRFYLTDGTLIRVVHNAGSKNILRPIKNFGYGEDCNKPRILLPHILRFFYATLKLLRGSR